MRRYGGQADEDGQPFPEVLLEVYQNEHHQLHKAGGHDSGVPRVACEEEGGVRAAPDQRGAGSEEERVDTGGGAEAQIRKRRAAEGIREDPEALLAESYSPLHAGLLPRGLYR